MRRADLSVVTADELGPGDAFGDACMLDEHRALTSGRRDSLNSNNDDGGDGDGDDDGDDDNNKKDDDISKKKKRSTKTREEREEEQEEQEVVPPAEPSALPRGRLPLASTTSGQEAERDKRRLEVPEKPGAFPAGSGEAGLTDAVDGSRGGGGGGGGGPNANPNAGRSMETYQTLEPTRLVLVLKADFHRIPELLKHCSHTFEVISACQQADAGGCVWLKYR